MNRGNTGIIPGKEIKNIMWREADEKSEYRNVGRKSEKPLMNGKKGYIR